MVAIVEVMHFRGRIRSILKFWRLELGSASCPSMTRLHDRSQGPGLTALDSEGKEDGIAWFISGPHAHGCPDSECTTVVFIHGYGLSAESFYDQVNYLKNQFPAVRCLLLDLRGHGLSDQVPLHEYTISGAADDVLGVINRKAPSGKLIIVGHSLGGMVAQNLIRRAPAQVYHRIDGALLIATSMQAFSQTGLASLLRFSLAKWLFNSARHLPGRANRLRRLVAQIIAPIFATILTGFPQMERLQFHVDMIMDTPVGAFAGFFDDIVHHQELEASERLSRLKGTIMVGALDIVTPRSQAETIKEHWPNARLEIVKGAGHMVILEEPAEVSKELAVLLT